MSQNQSTCSWEQFDENFCLKNSCFSIVFGHLEIVFRPFAEVFRNRRQNCFLVVKMNSLRKLFFGKKLFFLYLQRAKNFWHFVAEFISVVWKTAFYVSRGTIWGRIYKWFGTKSRFFFRLHTSSLFFSGFRQNISGSVIKDAFYVYIENFCGKTLFSAKEYDFLIILGFWAIFPLLSQIFSGIVKAAFQVSKCISRIFFENFSLLLLDMEQKDLVFSRRISGRVVKFHSTCPQELFGEQSLFRENVSFFLSFSKIKSISLTGLS